MYFTTELWWNTEEVVQCGCEINVSVGLVGPGVGSTHSLHGRSQYVEANSILVRGVAGPLWPPEPELRSYERRQIFRLKTRRRVTAAITIKDDDQRKGGKGQR